jgi:uncharacterized protein
MRFKINEIGDEGLPLDVRITSEWLETTCADLGAKPVPAGLLLRGRLSKSGDDYLLQARLSGGLDTTCARCLEAARIPIDANMVLTFVSADEDEEDEDANEDVVAFAGNEIDLSDEVRDEIFLAIPVKPLCSESCQGLCPVCGGNRNVVACLCESSQRQAMSGLAALGKLKI